MKDWLRTYFMYMRVGACAIPPGIVYGIYRVHGGSNPVVAYMAIFTALSLAVITEFGYMTKRRKTDA